ncbi:hypothetical protein [Vibrio harveyi]|uniref:hypothetical protein n=1 Tax=Vibrio harveyi TaxID=669 RepID=UPI003CEE0A28
MAKKKNNDDMAFAEVYPQRKTAKETGLKAAQLGAMIGLRFGPYGALIGGIAGLTVGIMADEFIED